MNKKEILDYVMNTPGNTNRAVLSSMLNSMEGSGGGSTPSEPTFNDGKTRLFITIPDLARPDMDINIGCTVAGGVTIDWGDGSETEVTTNTDRTAYTHNYTTTGDYVISLEVTDGELLLEGDVENGKGIVAAPYNRTRIRKVEIGDGVTSIGDGAFGGCYALTSVVIPEGVTGIDDYAFVACYALKSITIPSSVTGIGDNAFDHCLSLSSVVISEGVTSIGGDTFNSCGALTSITIPSSVTSIGPNAFYKCASMAAYYFEPVLPPTIMENTFDLLLPDCKIYVPTESLGVYADAPNWNQLIPYLVDEEGHGIDMI